ncbi:MAG: hypothetical protein KKA64_04825 [Nanoarchaeota archaeon]|nr:hypothetical protein [Nanoarchaeota archaeon]
MPITAKENIVGAWAFLTGVVLAIIIGVGTSTLMPVLAITEYSSMIYAVLVILGIVVGFVNLNGRDTQTFLLAGAVLVIVSKFGMDSVRGSLIGIGVGDIVTSIFGALLALFVPAIIIVAIKAVFSIAKI